ncbi:glycoside hydrolase family 3 N-terminal domain-containing protein [Flavobacterium johnsoniae]|uniref:beta-N-acetylhexosaminidase n=3 Tax=Flavobacterium johnsoniae TaxID=986 RepID=A5FAE4_FLAJ1|nr:glycoside hydrolase family 3 N-terminal domain-containing protein [Flavobacterium johnsoniae]ABQ07818.1 Candidate beta-glycosidase; Glycoside hydrolase family 3 [Flavobacterium johnsoniae UW101]OXG01898.1 beta-N-acetylglucosaminidase [Flavobacterium johnsoniae UW101]WQG80338.1 glycoside hydrolase family 3 N-terminal domain-containing protein [Flavobacterium johnsoniae UW101]SHL00925.1 beta-glucosidase [Flavobacterium johnsoniae]
MKDYIIKISLCASFLFLITNCAVKKNNTVTDSKKDIPLKDTIVYKEDKSEKKTFFKDSDKETAWVDSIYSKMPLREKVGQLFMVSAYSNKDSIHVNQVSKLIEEYKVGSVIFFQGGPVRQAKLTNLYQSKAKVPLFVGIDAEWGLAMRLDSTYRYPWNMTLGAIQDLKLIEKVGRNMANENKRIGVHFNFAPVLDINTNPKNPIIGNRSFGEDKVNVSEKAIALMNGIQGNGVFCTGKHFPGHGDTATDSHHALPTVNFSKERLDLVELYPYKRMFDEGLVSVMVAHLNIPSLEPIPNLPSSASYNVVTNLLQKELGFDGLIFTDGLAMKGAANFKGPGDLEIAVLLAGNDILLCPENVPVAVQKLEEAYNNNIITEERLAHSVKKILHYKYKAGLNHYKPIDMANIYNDLNPPQNDALHYQLYENAVTVLKNEKEILPIKELDQKIAYIKLGDDTNSAFISTLKKYTEITEVKDTNLDSLNKELKKFDKVIISFHKVNKPWEKQEFTLTEMLWLKEIAKHNKVILDVFAKPYSLLSITDFDDIEGLVVSYQNSDISQVVSAELLFGAIDAKGKLPVSINNSFKVNDGLTTEKLNRLAFTAPENVNMNPAILSKIDAVAQKAIDGKMAPGMQVLVARKGNVIFQKSYGSQTYDNGRKVTNTDLYDVASISKMISTLPNVMQLYDKNKVTLDTKLKDMLPFFAKTNKENIIFKDLLNHYAGLQAWIPFYKATLDSNTNPSEKYYRKTAENGFTTKVADNLYIRNDYHDTIMKIIADSPVSPKIEYKYSDFTFIILKEYLERKTHKKLEDLSKENFYSTLGMNYTLYNPLDKFEKNSIAPTEIDNYFRHQTIQGYVHDMAAAMEGGAAGHAGIFSNAMDVAKMMQLFLQKGNYGGIEYFSPQTFDAFNTCYYKDKGVLRGLGFDKRIGKDGPTCGCVSESSFGHTGFTGNMAWVDPETEIVYVFLSNRTYPEVVNDENKLAKGKIREEIQKIIQEAIIK